VPLVVLYPVLAATLGIGSVSKVTLGGLYAFFPIAIAATRSVAGPTPACSPRCARWAQGARVSPGR
jgi:ABC-type nitrate/sulfonate/bicarbonate transport system permease component